MAVVNNAKNIPVVGDVVVGVEYGSEYCKDGLTVKFLSGKRIFAHMRGLQELLAKSFEEKTSNDIAKVVEKLYEKLYPGDDALSQLNAINAIIELCFAHMDKLPDALKLNIMRFETKMLIDHMKREGITLEDSCLRCRVAAGEARGEEAVFCECEDGISYRDADGDCHACDPPCPMEADESECGCNEHEACSICAGTPGKEWAIEDYEDNERVCGADNCNECDPEEPKCDGCEFGCEIYRPTCGCESCEDCCADDDEACKVRLNVPAMNEEYLSSMSQNGDIILSTPDSLKGTIEINPSLTDVELSLDAVELESCNVLTPSIVVGFNLSTQEGIVEIKG